jgi:hypothetical protein
MRIVDDMPDDRLRDMSKHIQVQVQVIVEEDKVVYQYAGRLSNWICAKSVIKRYYWHPMFRDMDLRRLGKCRLILDITAAKEITDPLVLEPYLCGGGNEF